MSPHHLRAKLQDANHMIWYRATKKETNVTHHTSVGKMARVQGHMLLFLLGINLAARLDR